ncbi:putative NAD -binding protein [Rosellinia necatrix]|uniref:Putative NAD-binding protein n=1 Tax=Rosellinia necatrix TaxID=77044 RepID=A0A1W2TJP6_ROSNE|nr:putative NAD -binding protein [Rosellinia necatrix]
MTDTLQFNITPEKEASISQYFYRQFFGKTPELRKEDIDLRAKTAIITGASAGIGLEAARQLLDLGLKRLILAVRDVNKGEAAHKDLSAGREGNYVIEVWKLDLASYASVTEFSDRAKTLERLDIVILNAGLYKVTESFNSSTGFEEAVQINYLSNVLLLVSLLPTLKRKSPMSPARVVLLSSDTAAWVRFNPTGSILGTFKHKAERWDMQERYGVTKLLGQMFLTELSKHIPSSVVTIDAANPGLCYGTELQREGNGQLLGYIVRILTRLIGKPVAIGARTVVHAACSFGAEVHGQYVEDGEIRP